MARTGYFAKLVPILLNMSGGTVSHFELSCISGGWHASNQCLKSLRVVRREANQGGAPSLLLDACEAHRPRRLPSRFVKATSGATGVYAERFLSFTPPPKMALSKTAFRFPLPAASTNTIRALDGITYIRHSEDLTRKRKKGKEIKEDTGRTKKNEEDVKGDKMCRWDS